MNHHRDINGVAKGAIIYKDHTDHPPTSPRSRPRHQPRRGPLGLGIVEKDDVRALKALSALDDVPKEILDSPACLRDVLEAIDAAAGIRSDIDRPLKRRLAQLESDVGELKSGLATAQASLARMETMTAALKSVLPNKDDIKIRIAAEVKVRVAAEVKSHFDATAKRAADRRAAQKAK